MSDVNQKCIFYGIRWTMNKPGVVIQKQNSLHVFTSKLQIGNVAYNAMPLSFLFKLQCILRTKVFSKEQANVSKSHNPNCSDKCKIINQYRIRTELETTEES